MKISAYTVCYNEQALLPFFLLHYASIASRIVIWDNGSTDRTVEIARSYPHPDIEVRQFDTEDELQESRLVEIKNNCWKGDSADYVIVGDVDEFLYCADLHRFLESHAEFDLFRPRGYDMFSESFPADPNRPLTEQVKLGAANPAYSKAVLFRPNRLSEINYGPGCHGCRPLGDRLRFHDAERMPRSPLLLCHYKNLGFEYRWRKHEAYRQRLGRENLSNRWAWHYTLDREEQLRDFDDLRERAFQVLP